MRSHSSNVSVPTSSTFSWTKTSKPVSVFYLFFVQPKFSSFSFVTLFVIFYDNISSFRPPLLASMVDELTSPDNDSFLGTFTRLVVFANKGLLEKRREYIFLMDCR